jgi:hypothetical protein
MPAHVSYEDSETPARNQDDELDDVDQAELEHDDDRDLYGYDRGGPLEHATQMEIRIGAPITEAHLVELIARYSYLDERAAALWIDFGGEA